MSKLQRWLIWGLLPLLCGAVGCAIPVSKHPLVDPAEAKSFPELHGAYRFENPQASADEPPGYLHVGGAGEEFPSGFLRIVFVGQAESELKLQKLIGFVEKIGENYILHLPETDRDEDSEDPEDPWQEGWDAGRVKFYHLGRISVEEGKLYLTSLNSDFLVTEIEAGRLGGEVTRMEDQDKRPTSIHIIAETPQLRTFFEQHAGGELFRPLNRDEGHFVRVK